MRFFRNILVIMCICAFSAGAWWVPFKSNPITVTKECGQIQIGRTEQPDWMWKTNDNVAFLFLADRGQQLYVEKNNGKPGNFSLQFDFSQALKNFIFTTPECRNADLDRGDIVFGYSINADPQVKELVRLSKNDSGYVKGGTIAPRKCPEAAFSEKEEVRTLTLHVKIAGDVKYMMFAGPDRQGALIDYTVYNRIPMELLPDATRVGNTYYIDTPPHMVFRIPVRGVTVFDTTRGKEAGTCPLEQKDGVTIARLPHQLRPGVYELRAWNTAGELSALRRKIALVQRPRELSEAGLLASPFGMVRIEVDGRWNSIGPSLDCPMIGEMIGIHQIRGAEWAWVNTAPAPGKFAWDDPAWWKAWQEKVAHWKSHKLVPRSSLSWTPEWAVDKSRVAPGTWFGHYPPTKEFIPNYEEFCRETVRRTDGAKEYEIRNEPNNEPGGMWKGTLDEYVEFCKISADAVHSVDPKAKMILGTTADADIGFIARCLKGGLSNYYQIIDIHPYPHTRQAPEQFLLGNIRALQKLIKQYNGNQEIIFSEIGWPTQQFDLSSYERVSEMDQACFYSRLMLISLAGGVKQVDFYTVADFGTNPASAEQNFGIVRFDSTPKPSLAALSGTARHMEGARFLGALPTPVSHFVWAWKNPWHPDETLLTVWADTQAQKEGVTRLELPGVFAKAEDLWGGTPESDRVFVRDGKINVLPGADPLFVYVRNFPVKSLRPLPETLRPGQTPRKAVAPRLESLPVEREKMAYTTNYPFGALTLGYAGLNNDGKMLTAQAPGCETSFSVGWNDRDFLLNVRVKSTKPFFNGKTGWDVWEDDSIRLFLCPDVKTPYLTNDHYQIGIAPETAGHGPGGAFVISYDNKVPVGKAIPGTRIEAKNVADGWLMKVAIPWESLGFAPKAGDVWRFDLISPNGVWNSPGDDKWHNADNWGLVEFTN